MSDISNTNELIAALRERAVSDSPAHTLMNEAADALATRVPVQGEPSACLDHKPVQHRDGKPPWCNACGLATVPDAAHKEALYVMGLIETIKATGGSVEIHGVKIMPCDEYGRTEAVPDAATGRFECDRECIGEGAPVEDCSAHGRTPRDLWEQIDKVVAERDAATTKRDFAVALDGAPEPEWEYRTRWDRRKQLWFGVTHDHVAAHVAEGYEVQRCAARLWLPVEGESNA